MTTRLITAHTAGLAALLTTSLIFGATFDHAQAQHNGRCGFHRECPHIKVIPPSTGCYGWGSRCRNPAVKTYSNSPRASAPALPGGSASRRR
jgi:hypothetical protein